MSNESWISRRKQIFQEIFRKSCNDIWIFSQFDCRSSVGNLNYLVVVWIIGMHVRFCSCWAILNKYSRFIFAIYPKFNVLNLVSCFENLSRHNCRFVWMVCQSEWIIVHSISIFDTFMVSYNNSLKYLNYFFIIYLKRWRNPYAPWKVPASTPVCLTRTN